MENKTNLSDRLEYLKTSYNILRTKKKIKSWTDFAKLLEVNRTSLSTAKGGDPKYLTESLIDKVKGLMGEYESKAQATYDNLIPEITTEPNNLVPDSATESDIKISSLAMPYEQIKYVPTIPIHAYRAINFDVMEYFRTTKDKLHMSPIVMQFPGTDCYYFVNSEDMSPDLRTNDLLCLSRLPDEARVTNGDLCILNTKYQGIIGRFVYDDGEDLVLKSTQARWTDMRIPKEEVFSIFRILGGIRTNI